ncbi:hypothetical protein GS610_09425 [Ruegeria sp. HKCCD6228]|uniref:hypothetical protein n=1 Tax=Ruegeria sp. HKCCA5463 TaxID=2682994 RepID=UPI0019FB8FDF|nr:hypothetical protein [Ruegeria sp. HKCCA5463]NOC84367.1 hypothetical protein [Ruegeria sp. HKCCD6428]NOD97430.1 hypothetical protein [Ruegeria sp. HKCCD6228]
MENSPNDMVMGWLCRRVTGKSMKPEAGSYFYQWKELLQLIRRLNMSAAPL